MSQFLTVRLQEAEKSTKNKLEIVLLYNKSTPYIASPAFIRPTDKNKKT
jgi:hypothetical protein